MLRDWIQQKDKEIRAGKVTLAMRELIHRISRRFQEPIPREESTLIAALCRRTGLYFHSILLLHRYVRPKAREAERPRDLEAVEYAGALAQIGAEDEALEILHRMLSESVRERYPQVYLFEAFAYFSRWDYAKAIPVLKAYLKSSCIDAYARRVGKVNLLAALVIEREHAQAHELSRSLLESELENALLLRANVLGISAQSWIQLQEYGQAEEQLREAHGILEANEGSDRLLIEKWQAILELKRDGESGALARVRTEASRREEWETVRECDFYLGLQSKNLALLKHCYFGTPYPSYRARIENDSGLGPEYWGDRYDLNLWAGGNFGVSKSNTKPMLDLTELAGFSTLVQPNNLKPGQIIHRLLQILASDFYKPQHWVSIHSQLFPGRHLNALSSPNVIRQAIQRSRAWLGENCSRLAIRERKSFYSWVARRDCVVRVSRRLKPDRAEFYFDQLPPCSGTCFSTAELVQLWRIPKHTVIRVLNDLSFAGKIERVGGGRSVRFRVPQKKR